MNEHTQKRVQVRLEWALEDHKATTEKIYTFVSGENRDDKALWFEITKHLANTESHLKNVLRRIADSSSSESQV